MSRHFSEPFEPEDFFDQQEARQRRQNMDELIAENAKMAELEAEAQAKRDAVTAAKNRATGIRMLIRDYHAAGVEPLKVNEAGEPLVSLAMLKKIGWTIEESPHGNTLVAPAHNHHKRKTRADYDQSS